MTGKPFGLNILCIGTGCWCPALSDGPAEELDHVVFGWCLETPSGP